MAAIASPTHPPVELVGARLPGQEDLLGPAALAFLVDLHRAFEGERQARLAARRQRQARFDAGELPDFRADTRLIRESDWTVAPAPAALTDRRVEITGPVDPKMVINALNSGASCYMADFEDSTSPTWENLLTGQRALPAARAGVGEVLEHLLSEIVGIGLEPEGGVEHGAGPGASLLDQGPMHLDHGRSGLPRPDDDDASTHGLSLSLDVSACRCGWNLRRCTAI